MAQRRKRRTARSRNEQAGRSEPEKKAEPRGRQGDERRCWLCSEPLTSGGVTSMLGQGVFEVHQRCYDQAQKS